MMSIILVIIAYIILVILAFAAISVNGTPPKRPTSYQDNETLQWCLKHKDELVL